MSEIIRPPSPPLIDLCENRIRFRYATFCVQFPNIKFRAVSRAVPRLSAHFTPPTKRERGGVGEGKGEKPVSRPSHEGSHNFSRIAQRIVSIDRFARIGANGGAENRVIALSDRVRDRARENRYSRADICAGIRCCCCCGSTCTRASRGLHHVHTYYTSAYARRFANYRAPSGPRRNAQPTGGIVYALTTFLSHAWNAPLPSSLSFNAQLRPVDRRSLVHDARNNARLL